MGCAAERDGDISSSCLHRVTDGIRIDARQSVVDFNTGVREHNGNVRVAHQNLRLEAARLVEIRRDGQVVKVIAEGAPVRFEQQKPYQSGIRTATATKAEYSPLDGTLVLWNYTVWDVGDNRTRGKRGLYRFTPQ